MTSLRQQCGDAMHVAEKNLQGYFIVTEHSQHPLRGANGQRVTQRIR